MRQAAGPGEWRDFAAPLAAAVAVPAALGTSSSAQARAPYLYDVGFVRHPEAAEPARFAAVGRAVCGTVRVPALQPD
ncbi:hypothetical protein ACIQB5_45625 [Streptomyces sp. NPDC088560]|uniref:hypothetical protein n=1 Tax=Streptomyces sp. NPDC088560 TaxID=3365868 RepID=UPI0038122E3C